MPRRQNLPDQNNVNFSAEDMILTGDISAITDQQRQIGENGDFSVVFSRGKNPYNQPYEQLFDDHIQMVN